MMKSQTPFTGTIVKLTPIGVLSVQQVQSFYSKLQLCIFGYISTEIFKALGHEDGQDWMPQQICILHQYQCHGSSIYLAEVIIICKMADMASRKRYIIAPLPTSWKDV